MGPDRPSVRHRAVTGLLGGLLGAIVGAVFAVNLVIFSGVEGGYEASLSDVYHQRPIIAVLVVVALVVSPIVGAKLALHRLEERSRRS